MPYPNDLLEQARHLANREPKRPRQASLRRAVSTAYYALFHLLGMDLAKNWKRAAERSTLARMLEHGTMASVCDAKSKSLAKYFSQRPAPAATRERAVLKHLNVVAETFVQMYQQRQIADYNNSRKWGRTDVLQKIDSVESAFQSWHQVCNEAEAQSFLVTLLLRERKF
jgi:uncharacterized protein (UPF0332 family)